MLCLYNGILYSPEEERTSSAYTAMGPLLRCIVKWKTKMQTDKYHMVYDIKLQICLCMYRLPVEGSRGNSGK